jgi:membrane protease YdiL (CAAX protease family)
MSQHEKMAWWSLGAGALVWLFLLMRFTEDWQIVELSPGSAVATYVQMIVLWIVASAIPAVLSARDPEQAVKDERDRAIEALGDRWEGYVVVIAINVLVVHLLARGLFADRTPSVPLPDLGSTTALIFALLTTLFLAEAVKQAVVLWQYRR